MGEAKGAGVFHGFPFIYIYIYIVYIITNIVLSIQEKLF